MWMTLVPYEVVVVRVPSKVRSTECKTVVGARVDHPAKADVQGAEAEMSVAEQVKDGGLLLVLGSLLLGHHSGDHVVHFLLVEHHLVSLCNLLDLLLCLTILTLEIFWSTRLSQEDGTFEICHLTDSGTTHQ